MKTYFFNGNSKFILLFTFIIFISSCQKQNEAILKEKEIVPSESFSKSILSESDQEKLEQEEALLLPAEILNIEPGTTYKAASQPTSTPCEPEVTFNSSWNSSQNKYNCSAVHNGCTFWVPQYGSFFFVI